MENNIDKLRNMNQGNSGDLLRTWAVLGSESSKRWPNSVKYVFELYQDALTAPVDRRLEMIQQIRSLARLIVAHTPF